MKKKRSSYVYNPTPSLYRSRSRFDLSFSHKTAFNEGDLVPVYLQEVYPGDTFDLQTSVVVRTAVPFIRPIMDNLFMDMYYFFVPNRLTYDKWAQVLGYNNDSAWAPTEMAKVPSVYGKVATNSIADYMGVQTIGGQINSSGAVSRLPFRAFALIYDQWFRDENNQTPIYVNTTDVDTSEFNSNSFGPNNIYGMCPKANKVHDYFTSCLPAPQKGEAVDVPLNGIANVYAGAASEVSNRINGNYLYWIKNDGSPTASADKVLEVQDGATVGVSGASGGTGDSLVPKNLIINGDDLGASVNDIRFAFAVQRMLEKDARGGTRIDEYYQEHWGVMNPDSRVQKTELLAGKRFPLSLTGVAQTSSTTESSALGQVGAYCLSNGRSGYTKGFTEHGFVIGVACVRQFHTYQQGLERFFRRFTRNEFYDPSFAFIGEQPVYNYEIYNSSSTGNQVFGYNEAFADLRYRPNRISGMLRTGAGQGLDIWHLGDNYSSQPVLGDEFIKEFNYVDRCLSAPSTTIANFVCDFYFKQYGIRELPTYSIPSLVDHM